MRTHSAHPSSQYAPSPAACTQTGFPDRNTCTACRNAAQSRTSDTCRPPSFPAIPFRTARTATPPASPANSPASARAHDPTSADRWSAPAAAFAAPDSAVHYPAIPDRDPDTRVDGIWPQRLPSTRPVLSTQSTPMSKLLSVLCAGEGSGRLALACHPEEGACLPDEGPGRAARCVAGFATQ
jgi:hypothetical protein